MSSENHIMAMLIAYGGLDLVEAMEDSEQLKTTAERGRDNAAYHMKKKRRPQAWYSTAPPTPKRKHNQRSHNSGRN
jgi:hypothetical protein